MIARRNVESGKPTGDLQTALPRAKESQVAPPSALGSMTFGELLYFALLG